MIHFKKLAAAPACDNSVISIINFKALVGAYAIQINRLEDFELHSIANERKNQREIEISLDQL